MIRLNKKGCKIMQQVGTIHSVYNCATSITRVIDNRDHLGKGWATDVDTHIQNLIAMRETYKSRDEPSLMTPYQFGKECVKDD